MAETQKSDQERLIDETLSLFRNAIAETKTILPPVQFGRAVEHVPPSEPPEKRAASLISHAVSIARTVAGFVPKAVQTASPSLQPPVAKQAREKPVGDVQSDPLVDRVQSMVPIIPIEPNMAETASPPSLNTAEAEVLSLLQPVDKPASKDVLPLERPTQEEPPSLIDPAHSLVKKVVISEQVSVKEIAISEPRAVQTASPSLQPPVAKQAREKPVGDARADPLVDQVLSMVAIVPIDEPNMVEAASPPSPNTVEAAVLSPRQTVAKPDSEHVLPLEQSTQEKPPSLIDHAHSLAKKVVISEQVSVKEVAISEARAVQTASPSLQPPVAKQAREKPVGDARADPLVDQVLSMVAIVPIDEPNMVEAASPPSLNTVEAAVLSPRQTVAKPDSEHVLPLEQSTQEEPPSPIEHSTLVEPTALKTEAPVPLPQQPLMIQLSPKERLDMDRAEIRKRVVAFRHHQQRFQRDREEYYATTISKARAILGKAET